MTRIAVIGSGISGLAAAYYLSRKHEVFLFEKERRLGGHTHTVTVESSAGPLAVDTGFIVHNDLTYPNFIRLIKELGVPRVDSDMSFAVSCRKTGYEYSSRGVNGFFAQPKNLVKARPWRLFREIRRFNREATKILQQPGAEKLSLGEFLAEKKFSQEFCEFYLFPMASAVWSCGHSAVKEFPALTLIRFFDNHRFLSINNHAQWKTIPGGCGSYIAPITKPLAGRIFNGVAIREVSRDLSGVTISFKNGRPDLRFDQVVFATHGDQVLPLLADATPRERDVLEAFETSRNEVVLHSDERLLPERSAARASWNYLLHVDPRNGHGPVTMTYHMNRLQSLPVREHYCVTLNATGQIRPERVLRKFVYHHPLYTRRSIHAQVRWKEISGQNRTHFCGAYWFYGFHEDGVNSALRVANALGVQV
ncbi:MAG TPA: FAD-dependent oxidoreductase [Methylomirabilota bacterium]|nr:FAD-dependent oxidoreductase [Methylomirabilota bacterium]